MDQVLELKNIHYAYHNPDGETPAINGISFILNKGEFVAEGTAGHMVDLYKKILANQMDQLEDELVELNSEEMSDFSGDSAAGQKRKAEAHSGLMKEKLTINPAKTEYGDDYN